MAVERARVIERQEQPRKKGSMIWELRPVQLETHRRKIVSQLQRQIQAVRKGIASGQVKKQQGSRILEMLNRRQSRLSAPLSKETYASGQVYDRLIADEHSRRNFIITEKKGRAKELEKKTILWWRHKDRQQRAQKLRESIRRVAEREAVFNELTHRNRCNKPWATSDLSRYFFGEIDIRTDLTAREKEKVFFWLNKEGNNRLLQLKEQDRHWVLSNIVACCEDMPVETVKKIVVLSIDATEKGSRLFFDDVKTKQMKL
jgi:hypothetical protein